MSDPIHRGPSLEPEQTLRSMHEIAAKLPLDFEEQVREILSLGCRQFGLSVGMISRLRGDHLEIVESVTPDGPLPQGTLVPVDRSFCGETLRSDRPLGFHHASESEWSAHAAYTDLGYEAYVGMPLRVGNRSFGTICFASTVPRKTGFGPIDEEILRLMAQRIEAGLEQQRTEQELRAVFEGIAGVSGDSFFLSLCHHLARATNVRYALVTECTDASRERVRSLAFWAGDGFARNFEYNVAGAPCEDVLRRAEISFFPSGVRELFPRDRDLRTMRIESYIGAPILDSSSEVVGHLAAFDVAPMPRDERREWVLRIFAARAGAEIERKRVEQSLRASEERYSLATAAAKVGIWDWDIEHDRFYLDPNVKALLGYSDAEIPNDLEVWARHIHPDDREPVMQAATAHLDGRTPAYAYEHRMLHRDGSVRWFMVRGTAIRSDSGKPLRMIGTDVDITGRKRLEEALSKSEAKYRTLVEQIPAATYIGDWDPDCSTSYVSPPIEAMTGFTQEEWCAGPSRWRQQLHPDDRDAVLNNLDRSMKASEPFRAEYRMLTKDRRTIWVSDQSQGVYDDAGDPMFFQGVMIDITAKKQLEEELLQSHKLESLGILAGGVAHDFNNLLTGILGNASLALKDLDAGPLQEKLQRIEDAAVRAADLTRQMLAYSGQGRFVIEPLDLNELVDEMKHLLASVVSKKAELHDDLDASIPLIEADVTQIRQVVMNLIANASDALGDDAGSITLTTGVIDSSSEDGDTGPQIYLEVTDTGCGMDEETRQRMFDPFFSTKFSGRGLGLAAVQGIVRGHAGAFHVVSTPGRGTTVRVMFPATDRKPERREKRTPRLRWQGHGTVLVVDDEESVREVARSILAKLGFSAVTAADGVEGLELFRRHADRIVAVLLDLSMPRMGGEETLEKLRDLRGDVPVLMMSGYDAQQSLIRRDSGDHAGFIQKPYTVEELTAKLRQLLDSPTDH